MERKLENTKGFTFEERRLYGFPAYLDIRQNGEKLGQFYFNMTGYNPDFDLKNAAGVGYHLGEYSRSKAIREFKAAIREGFNLLTPYK